MNQTEEHSKSIPDELENDAIVEAIFEIQFDMATIPEVFFGRLADSKSWKNYNQRRLPTYEIPPPLRQADADLRYKPIFELVSDSEACAVRTGAHVISYHKYPPYGGWENFKPQIIEVVDAAFSKAENLLIRRLGFRYINALNVELHKLSSVSELDLKMTVENKSINSHVNLNFLREISDNTNCVTRISTPEFIQGTLPEGTTILVDVDIYTTKNFKTTEKKEVIDWIVSAHQEEKKQFFSLLTKATIEELRKK